MHKKLRQFNDVKSMYFLKEELNGFKKNLDQTEKKSRI